MRATFSSPAAEMSAGEIIRFLGLTPHPEGGHYRETWRDPRCGEDGRSFSSLIYFLLGVGEVSDWHRVDAAEVWHYYAGAPLVLSMSRMATTPRPRISAPAWRPASGRRSSFPRDGGKPPRASGRGHLSAAPFRPPSISQASSWRLPAGARPHEKPLHDPSAKALRPSSRPSLTLPSRQIWPS